MKKQEGETTFFGVCHTHRGDTGSERIVAIYAKLHSRFGPQHWWPARTPFEVCVGAILTQNTAWTNVEKAIGALRGARLLTCRAMAGASHAALARAIRPAGYFNQKAERLHLFATYLMGRCGGTFPRLGDVPTDALRAELLALKGIGPETADSMLLYAFRRPVFVVDAYTKRVFSRKGALDENAAYEDVQRFFEARLGHDTGFFNEYHALIVALAKAYCTKKNPRCGECPIKGL